MKRTLFAATAFAVVAGTAPLAFASTTTTPHVIVVPRDFNAALSDTRSTGHYAVVGSGLHIWTEGSTSTDKVAEYVNNNTALADVGEPTLDYTNTSGGLPGAQLVVDFNHDGTPDGILVGESVYSPDWWLNNGAQQFVKDGAPSHEGGSGSANHGTLDQWRTAFPDATLTAFGFSLGSGVKGDGTLNAITLGGTSYTFAALTPTRVLLIHPAGSSAVRIQLQTLPAGGGPVTGFVDLNDSSTGATVQKCELTSTTGKVTVPATCLPPGTYNLTAVYEGNDTFAGSSSAPQDVVIAQPTARVIETVNNKATSAKAVVKQPTGYSNFPTPMGLVSFYATDTSGGNYQNLCTDQELDSTGSSTCSLSSLTNGNYLIYAVYAGETYYNGNTSTGVPFTRKGAPAPVG